jgi:putative spermidine/putrescine transport system substrate-binding protein
MIAWPAGFTLVTDYWVSPKGTPHIESIYKFFEIFSRPDRQAEFMKIQAYSASNPEALALLPPERQAVLPTAPENAEFGVPVDDTFWAEQYDSLTERFNAWLAQ